MSFATSSKTLRATLKQVQHSQAFFVLANTEKQWKSIFCVKPRLSVSVCVRTHITGTFYVSFDTKWAKRVQTTSAVNITRGTSVKIL